MPFVDTPGLRVHYLQAGASGEPVVLLHGFPQTSLQWRHQLTALSEAGYACFAPDNRGFGATDKPDVRISRALLARDVVRFLDAVGLESAHFVTHDWGGIIGFKVVADYPDRVRSIALLDTLCTVWSPRARHGYWFKAEGLAEEFFARHASTFIEVTLGGRDVADLPGAPASPWRMPPGAQGRPSWMDQQSLQHFIEAFADPASQAACIQYYRYGLPFHAIDDSTGAPRLLSERQVGEMWLHPEGLDNHPLYKSPMDFGPEDRATVFGRPALWLYSRPTGQGSGGGARPVKAGAAAPSGNPFVDQFSRYFTDLRSGGVDAGHFLAEEAAEHTNAVLLDFLGGNRP